MEMEALACRIPRRVRLGGGSAASVIPVALSSWASSDARWGRTVL